MNTEIIIWIKSNVSGTWEYLGKTQILKLKIKNAMAYNLHLPGKKELQIMYYM